MVGFRGEIHLANAVETRPQRNAFTGRVLGIVGRDMTAQPFKTRPAQLELNDLATGKVGQNGIVESNNVQDALCRQQSRLEGDSPVGIRRLIIISVTPAHFQESARGKIRLLRPSAIRDIRALDDDPGMPAMTDQVHGFGRLIRPGQASRLSSRPGACAASHADKPYQEPS